MENKEESAWRNNRAELHSAAINIVTSSLRHSTRDNPEMQKTSTIPFLQQDMCSSGFPQHFLPSHICCVLFQQEIITDALSARFFIQIALYHI